MSDLIERQAAIDALDEYFERIGKLKRRGLNKGEKAISLDTVGAIKSLPSAQPEQRTGEWIDDGSELGCQCSECGKSLDEYIHATECMTLIEIPKFCPNCGAKMEGDAE